MIEKDRLMAITDGIVAIAATIMVMQLVVPDEPTVDGLMTQLPTVVAYIISYIQVFLAWHEHHDAFADAVSANHRIMFINALWLFFLTMLPFATALVGKHPESQFAEFIFIAVLLGFNLSIKAECSAIEKLNDIHMRDRAYILKLQKINLIGCGVAIIAAFIYPVASLGVIIAVDIISVFIICTYDKKLEPVIKEKIRKRKEEQ